MRAAVAESGLAVPDNAEASKADQELYSSDAVEQIVGILLFQPIDDSGRLIISEDVLVDIDGVLRNSGMRIMESYNYNAGDADFLRGEYSPPNMRDILGHCLREACKIANDLLVDPDRNAEKIREYTVRVCMMQSKYNAKDYANVPVLSHAAGAISLLLLE